MLVHAQEDREGSNACCRGYFVILSIIQVLRADDLD